MKIKVLFVCLGNICRSPAAEAVFRRFVNEAGREDAYEIDSAGLIDCHEGELADPRMRKYAAKRGYVLLHRSRPLRADDFDRFDWIVGMDRQNMKSLSRLSSGHERKLLKLSDFCTRYVVQSVPDPYYGEDAGFQHVLDLLEDACEGLLCSLEERAAAEQA